MGATTIHGRYYQMTPAERFKGHVEQDFDVDPGRAALLVIDIYGHGFAQDGTAANHPYSDNDTDKLWDDITLNHIRPAILAARSAGLPVIYAHNSAPNIRMERSEFGKQLRRSLQCDIAALNSEGRGAIDPREYLVSEGKHVLDIAPAVAPQQGDYYVRKHLYSGFKDTRLDSLLRNLDIKTVFCVGFDASVCLLCTVIDAFELNYEVVLLRDAVCAIEFPEDRDIHYSFTDRIIKWVEAMIGRSIEVREFIRFAQAIAPKGKT
jgi:nicotinamidase-related amidase